MILYSFEKDLNSLQSNYFTIVIPFFKNSNIKRWDNLRFVLKWLNFHGFFNIILVHQIHKEKSPSTSNSFNIQEKIELEIGEISWKSRMVNEGVKKVDTEFVFELDSDIVFNLTKFLLWAEFEIKRGARFLLPYKDFSYLDTTQSLTLRKRGEVKFIPRQGQFLDSPMAGSFLLRTEDYIRSGSIDERYVGWGWEDTEFCERVVKITGPPKVFDQSGVHMEHGNDRKLVIKEKFK